MQSKYGGVVPLPPDEAFDFVFNPAHWPRFFNSLESAEALEGQSTGRQGEDGDEGRR